MTFLEVCRSIRNAHLALKSPAAEKRVKECKKALDRITNSADDNPSENREKKRAQALAEYTRALSEYEQALKQDIEDLKK